MSSKDGDDIPARDASKSDSDPKSKDRHHAPAAEEASRTPKKRRKVNHACVYCRRSHMTCDLERPCMRCIKRNIAHLCHDEPRDADSKKPKNGVATSAVDESEQRSDTARTCSDHPPTSMGPSSLDANLAASTDQSTKVAFDAGALGQRNPLQLVQPTLISGMQGPPASRNMNQFASFSDTWLTAQNHFQDMQHFNPGYIIAPEVSNEFNLLNDFLHTSLLDEGALPDDSTLELGVNQASTRLLSSAMQGGPMLPPAAACGKAISRPTSVMPTDKAREYYLQAADPSGNDTPEERMQRLLKAKYDAGLLKPFNYIKGYARLSTYLDGHVASTSKQKILRQLDKFRPKFREKMHALTDMDLVIVEMWFEKTLMEYDRVFASMAVPACCWRRTGEIFRGNKEMAQLINVPVEMLRDGKIALHEILTEESVVRYWEEFGTIAFDPDHDTLLTACSLKSPDDKSHDPVMNCCFSFMIRRDDHKIPSLIVGNFLPHDPKPAH